MSPRIQYADELDKLNNDLLTMSTEIENAIDKLALAVDMLDVALANELIEGDDVFDHMERSIEKYCIDLVVKQAPIASDWRRIASIMRIVSDLERIADHCSDISVYVIRLSERSPVAPPLGIRETIRVMKSMVCDTISAFVRLDTALAAEVVQRDEIVDERFENTMSELCEMIRQRPDEVEQYVDYLLINKYVERMADHAVNVAEWIPYIASGEYRM
ncbi:MAG: phosphate signaling complex protein PhoU [Clostridiales bacterium]|nr:phosphate signaling complex protein PhoU [Clostridiales bacterium]